MLFDLKDSATREKLTAMIKQYRTGILPQLNLAITPAQNGGQQQQAAAGQSKFTWFSKQEVMDLFASNPSANGIRIYFASHNAPCPGDANELNALPGQLTVVLVPTEVADSREGLNSNDLLDGVVLDCGPICPPACPHPGTKLLLP